MKLKKILALMLALVSVMAVCTGCAFGSGNGETTPQVTMPVMNTYTAKAHLKIVDIKGDVIYSTEEEDEEMYSYESMYQEPTIYNFLDDYDNP